VGVVIGDHGTWNGLSEYIASEKEVRINHMQLMSYPMMAAISKIERLR